MITIFIDKSEKKPIYEQLTEKMKEMILTSFLTANEKLPSKRSLAQHLKISQITVETAYEQLKAEGYIRSVPRSGFFVEPFTEGFHLQHQAVEIVDIQFNSENYKYDLKTNEIDETNFPNRIFSKIARDIYLDAKPILLNEVELEGYIGLRKAIAIYLESYRGIIASYTQIIIGSGSDYLLNLITILLDPNYKYCMENPGFLKTRKLYQMLQRTLYLSELDEFGLDVMKIPTDTNVIHVSPSHQFPTGIVMPLKRRMELLNWANVHQDRYIIEDDYDSEFRFLGNPIAALKGLDKNGKVIYINSFSKSISPTKRISFMVLPLNLVGKMKQTLSFLSNPVPIHEQLILADFLINGHFERHLNKMKLIYKAKRDFLIDVLKRSKIGEYLSIEGETAGLHFILNLHQFVNALEVVAKAKKKGLRIYSLDEFFIGESASTEAKFIVGYANKSQADFQQIVSILEEVINI